MAAERSSPGKALVNRFQWGSPGTTVNSLRFYSLFIILLPSLYVHPGYANDRVAVASSLRQVWPVLIADFAESAGREQSAPLLAASFGSSGNLARQLLQGAPFDLFLSANSHYAARLVSAGLTQGEPLVFTKGQLAWVLPREAENRPGKATTTWANSDSVTLISRIDALLTMPETRLAIANPQHAPYGIAAQQVLQGRGVFDTLKSRLLLGENAAQTLQFVLVGGADLALVPVALLPPSTTLTRDSGRSQTSRNTGSASSVLVELEVRVVDNEKYAAVEHSVVLMAGASTTSELFLQYLSEPAARNILSSYGFSSP